jgi:hypothetical protein
VFSKSGYIFLMIPPVCIVFGLPLSSPSLLIIIFMRLLRDDSYPPWLPLLAPIRCGGTYLEVVPTAFIGLD